MKNSEKAVEEEESNLFNRLPDEVVLSIFNKLLDLKCLCCCFLVSTRFASIIPQVLAVSFTVPRRNSNSSSQANPNPDDNANLSKKLLRFLVAKPLRFLLRQIVAPKPVPSSISAFYGHSFRSGVYFLSKLKAIRSLQIELPSSCHGRDESLFKWRAKFGTKLETFAFLSCTSLCKMERFTGAGAGAGAGDDGEEEEGSELTRDMLKYRVHLAFQCLKDAIVRHRMLLFLIEQHPMLQSVAVTDSKKQGRLSVRGEQLSELRDWIGSSSATLGPQLKSIEVPVTARKCYVPVLQLPLSEYVMEGAALVVLGLVDLQESAGGDDDHDDGVVLAGAFEEGEEAFGEAVTEMMLNHKSKMKTLL